MSVVIRLMRAGAKKRPFFRMVAADSRRQRDGRFLEILGHYNPLTQPYELVVHKDRVETWISKGAQPSEQVASLLRSLGIALHRAPQPKPVAVEGVGPAEAAPKPAKKPKVMAKPAAKRSMARKVSARKVEKKAARKTAKKVAKKA
jgi:small subunit ribosomal protein S16